SGFKVGPVLDALKLDAIHSVCGHVTLDGSKSRIQGAILGNPAAGTLFDLWGEGQNSPVSLSLLPPTAVSYSETQFDLAALYEILKRVANAAMSPGQQNGAMMVDSLAQSRLGMTVPAVLGLFSGEFASMQLSPSLDPQKAVYLISIHKK